MGFKVRYQVQGSRSGVRGRVLGFRGCGQVSEFLGCTRSLTSKDQGLGPEWVGEGWQELVGWYGGLVVGMGGLDGRPRVGDVVKGYPRPENIRLCHDPK